MFDSSSFEMPSMPTTETAPERKTEGLGVTPEQMEEIADFFEKQLENPENKLIPLMANAEENGAWDILADEVNKRQGMNFSPEQLEAAMKGSEIFSRAAEAALSGEGLEVKMPPLPKIKKEGEPEGEDIDLSDLEEAA